MSKLVVAHRGGRSPAHPNTLDAFAYAISAGADMIELDVRRTADGELVVHHDEDIAGRLLATMNYAESVRCAETAGYRLDRFADVLDLCLGRIKLDVELKEAGYEDAVLRLLADASWLPADFVATSFELPAIPRLKAANPELRVGLLVCDMTSLAAVDLFRALRADFLGPDVQLLDASLRRESESSSIELLPWTVNDPEVIRDLLTWPSVSGIITDDPVVARDIRDAGLP